MLPKRPTYHTLNWRGYGHVTVVKFCRDAARRAGSSAIAELLLRIAVHLLVQSVDKISTDTERRAVRLLQRWAIAHSRPRKPTQLHRIFSTDVYF